jgi:hypothetical protein
MIGLHSAVVYQDRNAAGWGSPVFTNAYFDLDLTGWVTAPFDVAWTHGAGSAQVQTDGSTGSALNRAEASVIVRPANVATYRARAEVTVSHASEVFLNLYFGTTKLGASQGPFWRPTEAVQRWAALTVQAGTTVVEFTYDQTVNPPGAQYTWLGVGISIEPSPAVAVAYQAALSSLEVHYRSTGASADLSCLIDEISIQHGRGESTGQPEPSAATIDLTATGEEPLSPIVDIGAVIIVSTTTSQGSSTRFTGRVTDVALGWEDAGDETPYSGQVQVVAVGTIADLARRTVGDEPWPVERDGTRVARIADLAGLPLDPHWSDTGTVDILARDVDRSNALDRIHETAESAGGVLWQTRSGDVRYADADHRRGVAPSLDLDACDVLVTPAWIRNLDGLVNEVSIGYGVAPEGGGDQPRYTAEDAASIAKYGRYAISPTTELADSADAAAMGQLLLVRNSSPTWIMAALPVDVEGLSAQETDALLSLDMHDLIRLTGLPSLGTAPTSAVLWVEGWTERLSYGAHEMTIAISGYCRSSPPPLWDDVSPSWTWNTIPPYTWDETMCLGPQADLGRWADIPASKRWDELPPAQTWDTWTTTPALDAVGG